ncbi:unnamed protein product [Sphenostylis stenocarpa]|uniref:Uncharacterized protein n=1 Tax=Sphenostylis stenocarpa TaxID=92480 RepID=A0AA86T6U5_9FABA|nr:unnamed protein product [Sphenostylis stenocarpa]
MKLCGARIFSPLTNLQLQVDESPRRQRHTQTQLLFSSSSFQNQVDSSVHRDQNERARYVVVLAPPMADTDSSPSVPLQWNFSQVLGQQLLNETPQNDDIITTVAFEKRGDYLAVGDRGGRVILFERDDRKKSASSNRRDLEQRDLATLWHPKFRYKTEFQSHEPEARS